MKAYLLTSLLIASMHADAEKCHTYQHNGKTYHGIKVVYRVTDRAMIKLFRDTGAPEQTRYIEKRTLVLQKGKRYERETGYEWRPSDAQEAIYEKRLDDLTKKIENSPNPEPFYQQYAKLQAEGAKKSVIKIDKLRLRTVTEDYRLDLVRMQGYKSSGQFDVHPFLQTDGTFLTSTAGGRTLAQQYGALDTLVSSRRQVLGIPCNVIKGTMGYPMEICEANVGGHKLALETRVMNPAGEYHEIATQVDDVFCAPASLFKAPKGIRYLN